MIYPELTKVEKAFGKLGILINVAAAAYGVIIPLILLDILQSEQHIGYYYSLLSAGGLLINIFSVIIFSKFPKIKVFKVNILVSLFILMLMTIFKESFVFVVVNFIRALCMSTIGMAVTLMMRELLVGNNVKLAQTYYSKRTRIGSMIGGLLGGYSATYFGNDVVFIISGVLFFMAFLLFTHMSIYGDLKYYEIDRPKKPKHLKEKQQEFSKSKKLNGKKKSVISSYREYFSDKQRVFAYILGLFGGITDRIQGVYMPLVVVAMQYNQDVIANIKFGWAIFGFFMLGEKVRFSNKYGYKKSFVFGYSFSTLSYLVLSGFLSSGWAISLFIWFVLMDYPNHIGNGNRMFFFYDSTKDSDVDKYLGIYGTAWRTGTILGPIIASALFTISINYFGDSSYATLFKLVAGLMLIPSILSFFIISNKNLKIRMDKYKKKV